MTIFTFYNITWMEIQVMLFMTLLMYMYLKSFRISKIKYIQEHDQFISKHFAKSLALCQLENFRLA
jgi:hypothetical protein